MRAVTTPSTTSRRPKARSLRQRATTIDAEERRRVWLAVCWRESPRAVCVLALLVIALLQAVGPFEFARGLAAALFATLLLRRCPMVARRLALPTVATLLVLAVVHALPGPELRDVHMFDDDRGALALTDEGLIRLDPVTGATHWTAPLTVLDEIDGYRDRNERWVSEGPTVLINAHTAHLVRTIYAYDLRDGRRLATIPHPRTYRDVPLLAPGGRWLVHWRRDGIKLWDLEHPETGVYVGHSPEVRPEKVRLTLRDGRPVLWSTRHVARGGAVYLAVACLDIALYAHQAAAVAPQPAPPAAAVLIDQTLPIPCDSGELVDVRGRDALCVVFHKGEARALWVRDGHVRWSRPVEDPVGGRFDREGPPAVELFWRGTLQRLRLDADGNELPLRHASEPDAEIVTSVVGGALVTRRVTRYEVRDTPLRVVRPLPPWLRPWTLGLTAASLALALAAPLSPALALALFQVALVLLAAQLGWSPRPSSVGPRAGSLVWFCIVVASVVLWRTPRERRPYAALLVAPPLVALAWIATSAGKLSWILSPWYVSRG